MPARISVEVLRPAGGPAAAQPAGTRRARRGARVSAAGARLEPRDAGGILDLALDGLVARCGPCLGVVLLFWLPFGQLHELFARAGLDGFVSTLLWSLLTLIPHGFSISVVASLVGDALGGGETSVVPGILRGLRRAPAVLVILFATQIVALPLALLCFFPYLVAQWLTWAAVPMYVLEGEALLTPAERARARRHPLAAVAGIPLRIRRAIGRSLRLSSGWPAFGRWILLAIVGLLLFAGSFELTATALSEPAAREFLRTDLGLGGGPAEFALAAGSALFLALAAAVRGALMTAFYLDLRVRREGLDLALALRELEQPRARVGAS